MWHVLQLQIHFNLNSRRSNSEFFLHLFTKISRQKNCLPQIISSFELITAVCVWWTLWSKILSRKSEFILKVTFIDCMFIHPQTSRVETCKMVVFVCVCVEWKRKVMQKLIHLNDWIFDAPLILFSAQERSLSIEFAFYIVHKRSRMLTKALFQVVIGSEPFFLKILNELFNLHFNLKVRQSTCRQFWLILLLDFILCAESANMDGRLKSKFSAI